MTACSSSSSQLSPGTAGCGGTAGGAGALEADHLRNKKHYTQEAVDHLNAQGEPISEGHRRKKNSKF